MPQLTHGADVERLHDIAASLGEECEKITTLSRQGSAMADVLNSHWSGTDQATFQSEWSASVTALTSAASALRAWSARLLEQAEDQVQASTAARGGAASGKRAPLTGQPPATPGPTTSRGQSAQATSTSQAAVGSRAPDVNKVDNQVVGGTGGPDPHRPDGLGTGRPGTAAPTKPSAPAWTPPDGGAGKHDSQPVSKDALQTLAKARGMVAGARVKGWDDAARHMDHYLDGSGEPLGVDVDELIRDNGTVADAIKQRENDVASAAVEKARKEGVHGPVTYPVNTTWAHTFADNSQNWYYATNGMAHNAAGHVTVYPPDTPNGKWRYEMETQVNYRDRYNFDDGKSAPVNGDTVPDKDLADLHRAGLAKEYTLHGTSSTRRRSGSIS